VANYTPKSQKLTTAADATRDLRDQFLEAVGEIRLPSGETVLERFVAHLLPMFGTTYDAAVRSLARACPALGVENPQSDSRLAFDFGWRRAVMGAGVRDTPPTLEGEIAATLRSGRAVADLRSAVAGELSTLHLDGYPTRDHTTASVEWVRRAAWDRLLSWHTVAEEGRDVARKLGTSPFDLLSLSPNTVALWSLPPKLRGTQKTTGKEVVWVQIPADLLYPSPGLSPSDLAKRLLKWRGDKARALVRGEIASGRLTRDRQKRSARHFTWLARYQVAGERIQDIATRDGVTKGAVSAAVGEIAKAIDLPLRVGSLVRTRES